MLLTSEDVRGTRWVYVKPDTSTGIAWSEEGLSASEFWLRNSTLETTALPTQTSALKASSFLSTSFFSSNSPVGTVMSVVGGYLHPSYRQTATPPQACADVPPSLTMYSLYMHLADSDSDAEGHTPTLKSPAWWPKAVYQAGKKANDKVAFPTGLNIRATHEPNSEIIGLLTKDSIVEVEPKVGKRQRITGLRQGTLLIKKTGEHVSQLPSDFNGYVYLPELTQKQMPAAFDEVQVPEVPIPIKQGDLVGHLGEFVSSDATATEKNPATYPLLQLDVFTAQDLPAFIRQSRAYADKLDPKYTTLLKLDKGDPLKSRPNNDAPESHQVPEDVVIPLTKSTRKENGFIYVYLPELTQKQMPAAFDEVQVPETPIPIKQGDLVGHLGEFVSSDDAENASHIWLKRPYAAARQMEPSGVGVYLPLQQHQRS